jgi:hypothetical protein
VSEKEEEEEKGEGRREGRREEEDLPDVKVLLSTCVVDNQVV